jgi:threonine dehydrogenase-like Zn-dependent dehydrogenase
VFEEADRIVLQERPIPECGPTDAIVRVTMATICGTDVHILRGEYPVAPGRIVGHEPVGVIEKLGSAVVGYEVGDRVLCRCDHAVRQLLLLPEPLRGPVRRPRRLVGDDRRLAARQLDGRRPG